MAARASRFEGLSQKTSKQSIIMVTFVPKCLRKLNGIVFHNSSLDGHLISGDNLMYVTSSQAVNTLEAVDVDTPNLYPRSHNGKFSLSLIIVNKIAETLIGKFLQLC